MIWVRELNDWCCGLQETIVVTVYLFGCMRRPHTNSPSPPPAVEAPHRLSTLLHISQMLQPPTTLLLLSPIFSLIPLHRALLPMWKGK